MLSGRSPAAADMTSLVDQLPPFKFSLSFIFSLAHFVCGGIRDRYLFFDFL